MSGSFAVQAQVTDMGSDYRRSALQGGNRALVMALLSISVELHGIRSALCELESDSYAARLGRELEDHLRYDKPGHSVKA